MDNFLKVLGGGVVALVALLAYVAVIVFKFGAVMYLVVPLAVILLVTTVYLSARTS